MGNYENKCKPKQKPNAKSTIYMKMTDEEEELEECAEDIAHKVSETCLDADGEKCDTFFYHGECHDTELECTESANEELGGDCVAEDGSVCEAHHYYYHGACQDGPQITWEKYETSFCQNVNRADMLPLDEGETADHLLE